MTQGAQVGRALPGLVGLFDLRGWPRSSWGQASFKLALSRATCGRRLFPSRLEGMSRVCTQRFSLSLAAGGAISDVALGASAAGIAVTVTVGSSRISQRQALAFLVLRVCHAGEESCKTPGSAARGPRNVSVH